MTDSVVEGTGEPSDDELIAMYLEVDSIEHVNPDALRFIYRAGVATHNTPEDSNQKVQVDLLAHALHVADGYGDGWTFLPPYRKDAYWVCASRVQTWLLDEAEGRHATGEELIARVRRDVTALASRADHRDVALLVPTSKEHT